MCLPATSEDPISPEVVLNQEKTTENEYQKKKVNFANHEIYFSKISLNRWKSLLISYPKEVLFRLGNVSQTIWRFWTFVSTKTWEAVAVKSGHHVLSPRVARSSTRRSDRRVVHRVPAHTVRLFTIAEKSITNLQVRTPRISTGISYRQWRSPARTTTNRGKNVVRRTLSTEITLLKHWVSRKMKTISYYGTLKLLQ